MNKQIIEEAAEWFVEFSTGDADRTAKQAFDEWLRKSPEHVRVYLELLPLWEDAALPSPGERASADELIAWARKSENIVPWSGTREAEELGEISGGTSRNAGRPRGSGPLLNRALAASVALAVVVGGSVFWSLAGGETYATGIGEQRVIKLDDGSTVELNTGSRIRVHFSEHRRDLDLVAGQAMFHVAKDPRRPFIVASNDTRIRAVGTEFDVYRRESDTTVTVLEGQVAVLDSTAGGDRGDLAATPLSAGEQITVEMRMAAATSPPLPKRTNVAAATAWTQHRLVFDSTPLTMVAEEFNRYNTRHVIVEGKGLSEFHISGSFASTDPSSLLRFLETQPGLIVHETAADIRISSR